MPGRRLGAVRTRWPPRSRPSLALRIPQPRHRRTGIAVQAAANCNWIFKAHLRAPDSIVPDGPSPDAKVRIFLHNETRWHASLGRLALGTTQRRGRIAAEPRIIAPKAGTMNSSKGASCRSFLSVG